MKTTKAQHDFSWSQAGFFRFFKSVWKNPQPQLDMGSIWPSTSSDKEKTFGLFVFFLGKKKYPIRDYFISPWKDPVANPEW